jgi:hypothetical protein
MELERKIVRLTIRRLRKALKKFHTDIEAAKQENLQLQSQQSPGAAFASSVDEQSRGAQQVIASLASMPPGQRDPRRRPWKKCLAGHEDNSAVTLNGHIEEILGTSALSEEPAILSWIEKGIQELQRKENLEPQHKVARLFFVHNMNSSPLQTLNLVFFVYFSFLITSSLILFPLWKCGYSKKLHALILKIRNPFFGKGYSQS